MKMASVNCSTPDCPRRGYYIEKGVGDVVHCFYHKTENERKVSQKCIIKGCSLNASYGDSVSRARTHCKTHKDPGYVYLIGQTCESPGCISMSPDNTQGRNCRCSEYIMDTNVYCRSKKRARRNTESESSVLMIPSGGLFGDELRRIEKILEHLSNADY
jgi:hypothetical protein